MKGLGTRRPFPGKSACNLQPLPRFLFLLLPFLALVTMPLTTHASVSSQPTDDKHLPLP